MQTLTQVPILPLRRCRLPLMTECALCGSHRSHRAAAGNLIRTPDGRLAILDFGLMTQISPEIKVTLSSL